MKKLKKLTHLLLLVLLCASMGSPATAVAADTKTTDSKATNTDSGVQGYAADKQIPVGTIVQLQGSGASKVEVSTKADIGHMYGVAVDKLKLSITISNSAIQNEVFVATAGTYDTLVSSQGGTIKAGDYVTLSSVDGVAKKASTDDTTVFGRAAANFEGKGDSIGKTTLKDTSGKASQEVALGVIPVSIDVRTNPEKKSTKTKVPDFLQRIGAAVADKPVGPLRMYLSIAITALTIAAAIVILYSGVRSSIIAIGRNPLSKKSVFRGLLEIIFTSILIMIIGLFAVYLLLKL